MRCEQCGQDLIEGSHFCGECGARVGQPVASNAVASKAAAPDAASPNPVAATEFASEAASGAGANADTSRGPKTAPMAEAPDLRSSGVALTDPMAGVPIPQHSPLDLPARAGKPATTLPLQQSRPKSRRGLIAALLLIACASLAGLLFAANRKLPLKWPLQGGAPAPPPLISAPAPTGVEAPAHVEPLPVDPAPLPPAPARPPPAPAPRPAVPAPPMTPPSTTPPLTVPPMPPVLPGTPPAIPTVPPNAPPALPPTPSPAPNPAPPAPGLPTLPGIPLPWGNAAAGACDRCIAEVRNGGHYAIPLAAAQHLLCDDPAARERCAVDIREASPALAERAARDGDCAAAWATKAAALNLGVSADRFGNVDALCNR